MLQRFVVFPSFLWVMFLCAHAAVAGPISSCTAGINATTFSCEIFPTNSLGNLVNDTGFIQIPLGADPVSPGYVIVLDPGTPVADEDNPAYWEEVLWFAGNLAGGSQSSELELFAGTAMPSFAVISTFDGGGHDYFLFENPDGIVQYCAPAHCYTIYDSDATEALINSGSGPTGGSGEGGLSGSLGGSGSSGGSGGSGGSGSSGGSGGSGSSGSTGGSGSSGGSGGSGSSGGSGASGGSGPIGPSGPTGLGGSGSSGASGPGGTPPSDVPEPATVGLMLVGMAVLGAIRARKHGC